MEATGALPVSRGSEDTERLPIQVLEIQALRERREPLCSKGSARKKSKWE